MVALADTTEDRLLGGRVTLFQPQGGYRAAIDPVLLAAAIPATHSDLVLDAGSGTGAASLALAARVAGCQVTGLEAQAGLVALADSSAKASGLSDRVKFSPRRPACPPGRPQPRRFRPCHGQSALSSGRARQPAPRPGEAGGDG